MKAEELERPEEIRIDERRKAGRPKGTGLNGRMRVLTPDEEERLLVAADRDGAKYGLIIRLILHLALRVSEVVSMRVEDFNALSRPHQVTVRGAKGGFTRTYDLPDRLYGRYQRWMKRREPKDSPWLFPHRLYGRDEHMSTAGVQGTFRVLCLKANIPGQHSVHDLRHTAATRMAMSGDGVAQIAGRMRHRNVNSSQRYIEMRGNLEHDAVMMRRYKD